MMSLFSLSADLLFLAAKWLIIITIWLFWLWGALREDKQLKKCLHDPSHSANTGFILKAFYRRSNQLGILITLLLLTEAANDMHHTVSSIQISNVPPSSIIAAVASTAAKTPEKPAISAGLPFSDITEFNEKDSKEQAYIDWLKERYEAWFVTYYYLHKCAQNNAQDFDVIRIALEQELFKAHAQSNVENNILLASQGSYNEMYSEIPCDSRHINSTKATYDANMQQLTASTRLLQPSQPQLQEHPKPNTAQ